MYARTHDSITTCVTQPFRLDSNCCRAGRRFQRLRALTYNLCNTDKELQSGIAQTCRQHRRCPKMRTPASSVSGLFVSLWVSLRLPLGVSSPPSGCLFVSLWVDQWVDQRLALELALTHTDTDTGAGAEEKTKQRERETRRWDRGRWAEAGT